MKNRTTSLVMALSVAALQTGMAQQPKHLQPNEFPTNIAGVTTIAQPPDGFDPISASDADLAYHGFPPRPDQDAMPKAYASWVKAMNASKKRVAARLEQTAVLHGPARLKGKPGTNGKVSNPAESYNWSGYVNLSGATSYGSTSFYYVYSDFIVPTAQQAFDACSNGWDWGSSWVGIDGWGSGDVLQSGIEFDAFCSTSGAGRSQYYSPWYEWYPYGEVRITSLPIAPGDDVFVEVWSTSATQGYAYMVDESDNTSVEVGFTAPAGTKLIGNSAEWVTERPSVGGTLTNLTNYTAGPYWGSYAVNFGYTAVDPGSASSFGVMMLDNGGKPISYPTLLGPSGFLMQDEGSVR